jgi:hypothetical protein
MQSLSQTFIQIMDTPLTLAHPVAIASISLIGFCFFAALGLVWLRLKIIKPSIADLQNEQIELLKELKAARKDLALVKKQFSEGVELLSDVRHQIQLQTLLRIVLSVGLNLGQKGVLALMYRFLKKRFVWQFLLKKGLEEASLRLLDSLIILLPHPHDS